MKKLKIGMISFAHADHPDHYLNWLLSHPDVEVTGIAEEDKSRVQDHLDKYNIDYYSDYKDLLKTDCEAVIICSEYAYHSKLTIESALAGKHVFCEKPLGLSIEEMENMINVCREQNVQLMTAFPCRFLTAVQETKKIINSDEIGEILSIKGTNRGVMNFGWFVNPELSGGGSIMDHTVHIMDIMNWILSTRVEEVHAVAGTLLYDVDVEDCGLVHVKFENGTIGLIDTSWSLAESYPEDYEVKLNIVGTKGSITVDALSQKNEVYSDEVMKTQWSFWGDDMNKELIYAFVNSIRDDIQVPVTGEDGFHSTSVAIAAKESMQTGQPVKMKEILNEK